MAPSSVTMHIIAWVSLRGKNFRYLNRAVDFLLASTSETFWVMRDKILAVDLKMSSMLRMRSLYQLLISALSFSVSTPGSSFMESTMESTYRRYACAEGTRPAEV